MLAYLRRKFLYILLLSQKDDTVFTLQMHWNGSLAAVQLKTLDMKCLLISGVKGAHEYRNTVS